MAWQIPQYTPDKIDKAGAVLISQSAEYFEVSDAVRIIDNWRSSHYFPLNTIQNGLRLKALKVSKKGLVAQRIKRLSSIQMKLHRYPKLKLSEIQDIGGCRAVVETVPQVNRLVFLYDKSSQKHVLIDEDDYIQNPKSSGYRSYHLIYQYRSLSRANSVYNGMKIEIQLRTQLQHAWATAVETVGAFTQQALKASTGQKEWLRFFALMGTVIANKEKTPLVPKTPTIQHDLKEELLEYYNTLDVVTHLQAYQAAITSSPRFAREPGVQYQLLVLDMNSRKLRIQNYSNGNLEKAFQDLATTESEIKDRKGIDAVLVSVKSLNALRRAYPNYFLDTHVFLNEVKEAIRT